jgi:hypothetical protein
LQPALLFLAVVDWKGDMAMCIFILLEAVLKNVLITATTKQQGTHHQTQTNRLFDAEKWFYKELHMCSKDFQDRRLKPLGHCSIIASDRD